MSESSSRTLREASAEASEIKSPIKKLKEEVKELKDLVSSLIERVVKLEGNKENIKPNNKPDITDANYNYRRSAYTSKLNNKDIKQPKDETMRYYNVVYDEDKKFHF